MSPIYHLDVHTSHDIQKLEMQGQDMQNQMYQIKATESPKEPCEEEQTSIMLLLLPLYTDLAIYAPQLHNVKFPEKKNGSISAGFIPISCNYYGKLPIESHIVTISTIQGKLEVVTEALENACEKESIKRHFSH